MLAPEIGTKRTAGVRWPLFAVAYRQHSREKDPGRPVTPLHGHTVVQTINGVRMLGCAIRFR